MKKQRYLDSLLRSASRILQAAGLAEDDYAVAMNRLYKYYSGDDVFKICGITVEKRYTSYNSLTINETDPQLTIEDAIAKSEVKQDDR
ncbi:MAG: hypothetical protein II870_02790 [Synergistaceae bacterium]|nr:hypothetical protein [Synergistaceae bacterium]